MTLAILVVAATAGLALWSRFCRWEREGRRELVLAVVLGAVVADLILYPSQNNVPIGLFRPYVAGQSFRLSELLIVVGLLARVAVSGGPRRFTAVGLAWTAFSVWYGAAAVSGLLAGNPIEDVLFQAKVIIYIAGGLGLAAGVDPSRLVTTKAIGSWFVGLGAVVAVMFPLTLRTSDLRLALPGLALDDLGELGPDGASAVVVLATIALLVEGCRRNRRALIGLAAMPMVVSVFASTQRAAMLGLAVTAALLVVLATSGTWRKRLRTTPTSIFLVITVVAVAAASLALLQIRKGERLPVVDAYEETFLATKKQQSADIRVMLWREARLLYDERPFVGHGLGVPFEVPVPRTDRVVDSGFHNLVWDLLARTGIIGLVLFLLAVAVTLREGWRGWRGHADARVAALALGAVLGLASLLAKGMVEDVFEKHRLATLLGLLLGIMVAAGNAVREGTDVDEDVVVHGRTDGSTALAHVTGAGAAPEPRAAQDIMRENAAWS
ncbi:MAG: O-antigen ligase family protein [Acidimicrobiia bacterium]|nr:O-antigen ligase family protein [Acidimicrobiia bacterium]